MSDPKLRVRASGFGGSGYRIPTWLDSNGKPNIVPGVTTALKVINKPGLNQWYADIVAAHASVNPDALFSKTEGDGFTFLRYAAGYELKRLGDIGTNIHEWAESYLRGDFARPTLETEEAAQMAERFKEWVVDNNVEWYGSELTVVNKEIGYAGTLDILCKIDGKIYIVDIKSGRNIWPEAKMQQAALLHAETYMREVDADTEGATEYLVQGTKDKTYWVEDELPVKPEGAIILHIRPDDVDNQGTILDSFYKQIAVEHTDEYYEGFVSALTMTKVLTRINKLDKE